MTRNIVWHNTVAWLALLALLALTCGSAFVPLGAWNAAINMGIAAIKALVVLIVFMKLGRAATTVRLAALLAIATLALLAGLTLTDFVPRDHQPGGWQVGTDRGPADAADRGRTKP